MLSISSVVLLLLLAAALTTAKNVYTGSVSIGFDEIKSLGDSSHMLTSSREDARLATLLPKQERRHPVSAVQRTVPTASMQYPIKINGLSETSENQLQPYKEPKSKEELEMINDLERVQKLKQRQKELRKHLEEQENRRLESIRKRVEAQKRMDEERRQLLALQAQRNSERAQQEKEYQRQLASERERMNEELRLQEEERQKLENEKQLMEQELNKQKFIEEQRRQAEEERRVKIEHERAEEERKRAEEESRRQQTEEELRRHLEEERRQRLAEEYRRKQNEERMKEELRRREHAERERLAEVRRQTEELRREDERERKRVAAEENKKQAEERNRMLEEMEKIANERMEIEKEKKRLEEERNRLQELLHQKKEERKKIDTQKEYVHERNEKELRNMVQPTPPTKIQDLENVASTYRYMMPTEDVSPTTIRPLKKKIIKINRLPKLKALPIIHMDKIETSTTEPVYTTSIMPTFAPTTTPQLFTVGKPQLVIPLVRRKISLKPGGEENEETTTQRQRILNAGYNNYYQEWYKNTETTTHQAFTLPTIPPAWADQLSNGGGGFYGIMDPRLEGKHINKEQLDKMCISIKGLTKAFGIKKPKTFAEQNCSLIKMYYKQVTCEQIVHVMEYCEPMLSTRRH